MYSGNGTYKGAFGRLGVKKGHFVRPQGIYITNDRKVYVSDTFNFRVDVFDIEGRLVQTVGEQGNFINVVTTSKKWEIIASNLSKTAKKCYAIRSGLHVQ